MPSWATMPEEYLKAATNRRGWSGVTPRWTLLWSAAHIRALRIAGLRGGGKRTAMGRRGIGNRGGELSGHARVVEARHGWGVGGTADGAGHVESRAGSDCAARCLGSGCTVYTAQSQKPDLGSAMYAHAVHLGTRPVDACWARTSAHLPELAVHTAGCVWCAQVLLLQRKHVVTTVQPRKHAYAVRIGSRRGGEAGQWGAVPKSRAAVQHGSLLNNLRGAQEAAIAGSNQTYLGPGHWAEQKARLSRWVPKVDPVLV
jgi:hypothetical protein